MLLLGYPSLVWPGGMALVGGRATCSSAANHRTCRLLGQQHRPAAACQILYGLACRTDKHAVQQLLPVLPAGPGGRYLVYHSRCITALRTGQYYFLLLLRADMSRSLSPQSVLSPPRKHKVASNGEEKPVIVSPDRYRAEESPPAGLAHFQ